MSLTLHFHPRPSYARVIEEAKPYFSMLPI
jgi:hypothetical protein